jgi:SEFIR domain
MPEAAPRVFISYSHDSPEHRDRVLALADRLQADGVETELDQYETLPAEGWPAWCEKMIRRADFVLMVCTETYLRRIHDEEEGGQGYGVLWEARLIRQHLYKAGAANGKFVPVLLSGSDAAYLPEMVGGTTRFRLETEDGYESLYRLLTDQPAVRRPQLGPRRRLPERPRLSLAEIERPPDRQNTTRPEPPLAPGLPTFFELYERFKAQWAPNLVGRQLAGLSLADTVDWILRSLEFHFRSEWLRMLARYAEDKNLPPRLPADQENVIRQLRNLGLIRHEGRSLFEPSRSREIAPSPTGTLILALSRDQRLPEIERVAEEVVRELAEIAGNPATMAQLQEVSRQGTTSDIETVRKLRNLHLVSQPGSFLSGDGLAVTGLGDYVLRRGFRAAHPQRNNQPAAEEPVLLAHPGWARALWSKPQACKFHIVTSRYDRKRRWRKYADILVEVTEPVLEGISGEAYLLPSVAAHPVLRDAEYLTSDAGKQTRERKSAASGRFIEASGNRLLDEAWFVMSAQNGSGEIGVYCAAYDAFLNDCSLDPQSGVP